MASQQPDLHLGRIFSDKYRVEERLGSGGMCHVYRARHIVIDKEVALKVLRAELAADPQVAVQFEQEARATSRIHHPHAVDVTDFGVTEDSWYFIIMELVQGPTLGAVLRRCGAFPMDRAGNILRQICGALEAAHAAGVVHRDVKTDNIILSKFEGADWV